MSATVHNMDDDIDNDIIFDRNDGLAHEEISQLKELKRTVNETPMSEYTKEIADARKRTINKLLDIMSIQNDINNALPESIIDNTDIIDSDMFLVGVIENKTLTIDIPPVTITINLQKAINNAILHKKPKLIRLMMEKQIDLFSIEPKIMLICATNKLDDLLLELIGKKVDICTNEPKCIYQLAAYGKLDFIRFILQQYTFPDLPKIISKICIQAILNNHVHILEYFLTKDAFIGAPDQMFCFFINSICYGGHLDIIKFFVNAGINIKQNNYQAVHQAIKFDLDLLVKYFYDIEPSVDHILTEDQKQKYGLFKITMEKKYIGIEKSCNIYYDDILPGDTYFQCGSGQHQFKEQAWLQWTKQKINWNCPCCQCLVKRTLYINSNDGLVDK